MNNEIKEILNYLTKFINDKEEITKYGCEISVKQAKQLLDYITNLQEENEELREDNFAYHQLMKTQNKREYRSKFLKDFQKEYGENVFPDYDEIYKRYDNYKTRNELAIEYINKNYDTDIEDVFELLEILQGKSDE